MWFHSLHTYQTVLAPPPPPPAAGKGGERTNKRKGEIVAEEEKGIVLPFLVFTPHCPYLPPTSLWLLSLLKKKAQDGQETVQTTEETKKGCFPHTLYNGRLSVLITSYVA